MTNKKPATQRSLLTPQFALLLLATGTFGIAFSTYFLMPKYLAVELTADAATIGAVSAITLLASVVAMPFIGVQGRSAGSQRFWGAWGKYLRPRL